MTLNGSIAQSYFEIYWLGLLTRMKGTEDTINKSLLLNWLNASDKNLPIKELKKWIEGNTNGKYSIVKQELDS